MLSTMFTALSQDTNTNRNFRFSPEQSRVEQSPEEVVAALDIGLLAGVRIQKITNLPAVAYLLTTERGAMAGNRDSPGEDEE